MLIGPAAVHSVPSMRPHSPKNVLRFALPTLAALGAGAAVGLAAIPSADGTIHACVSTTSVPAGAVRIIDADTTQCAASETPLVWNQQGPAGPKGDPGPQGDPGLNSTSSSTPSDNSSSSTDDTFPTPSQAGGPSADMFLKVDGIKGDSTDDRHEHEIDLESFAFALGRGGDGTGASSGAAAAKARLMTLRVDKVYDASSPKLFRAAATGQHVKSAVLTFRKPGDRDAFLTYTLSDVQVTSYDQGANDGDARDLGSLEEEVGFTAARIHVTEQTVDATGKKSPAVNADWTLPKTGRK